MEPVTLITAAITLVMPYILKAGEKIAENVGEDIWKLIKRPFVNQKESELVHDITDSIRKQELIQKLVEKINEDPTFKQELENAVNNAHQTLNAQNQQNINNNGQIQKQINIQDNKGNIQM
ncbi:MAG: hypothetical protein F9K23_07615 [Bacteroidetes bacterium]|nr:MAG: hypothetical protein F9K23_07615 [Bacteroidota bacterium]